VECGAVRRFDEAEKRCRRFALPPQSKERLAKRGPFRTANGRQGARTIFLLPLGGEGGRRPDEGAATRPPNTSSIGFTPAL